MACECKSQEARSIAHILQKSVIDTATPAKDGGNHSDQSYMRSTACNDPLIVNHAAVHAHAPCKAFGVHHRSDGWAPCAAAALICSSVAPFRFLASFCTLFTNVPHTPTISSVELTQGSAEHVEQ